MGKVRIYDLAKELKLDNKKIIEDARRLGCDGVHQASNSVPDEIAQKIREKYFPKKTVTSQAPKLVKVPKKVTPAAAPDQAASAPAEAPAPVSASEVQEAKRVEKTAVQPAPSVPKPRVIKLVEKEIPKPAPAPPPPPVAPPSQQPVQQKTRVVELPQPAAKEPAPQSAPQPAAAKPAAAQTQAPARVAKQPEAPKPSPTKPTIRVLVPSTAATASTVSISLPLPAEEAEPGLPQRTTYIPPRDKRPRGMRPKGKHRGAETAARGRVKSEDIDDGKLLPPVPVFTQVAAPRPVFTELKPIKLTEGTTVKELSDKLNVKAKDVVSLLLKKGVLATVNQTIDVNVARDVGKEFGYDISFVPFEEIIAETEAQQLSDDGAELVTRAPVVTVMGHVDHGKTSLLDAIRQTRVAEGEAGGITQHIGAYSVEVTDPDDRTRLRRIVFLDTPGHEAFTMMRARGARVTDVVVLVVAADDGVMPQTIEAIDHARAANVPIVVAINKIDKPDANPERVKQALSDRGLVWDGWGGDTVMVEVSAKKKINLDALLEMILLTADIADLKANPKRLAAGTVLEAKLDRGRGAVATVLVQNGTLKVGDPFLVGAIFGRVRAMFDDRGRPVLEAGPATPVEVLGFAEVPHAGDHFQVVDDIAKAQQISAYRQAQQRAAQLRATARKDISDIAKSIQAGNLKKLLVILKADVQGSVEVLKETLNKLSTEKVEVRIIRSGVGAITESDVLLASASNEMNQRAIIIGFNVRPEPRAEELAKNEGIEILLHSVIYKLEQELRGAMIGMLDVTKREVTIGKAEVRQLIRVPKVGVVAGSAVISGTIKRNAQVRLVRDNIVIQETKIASLRRFKDDVSEVKQGFECGILLENFNDLKIGDVIEAYIMEEVAPTEL